MKRTATTTQKNGALIYTRVSSQEQVANHSLATQEKACVEYCEREGLEVIRVFVEAGESAKTANRTQLQAMLSFVGEHYKRISTVVVYSISRWSRHNADHYFLRSILSKHGVTLRSVTETITDTPEGQFLEAVMASAAMYENLTKAERSKTSMRDRLQQGDWMFRPPLGYTKVGPPKRRQVVEEEGTGPLIRKAFTMMATGAYTCQQVLDIVTGEGLRTSKSKAVPLQTFRRLLSNEFYAGWLTVKDWEIKQRGDFTPLIDQVTFDTVQRVLSGRTARAVPHSRNNADFPLRKTVRCGGCGGPLTGSWSRGRNKKYAYYHCPQTCAGMTIAKDRLEEEFVMLLERMAPRPAYLKLFNAIVLDVWRQKQAEAKQEVAGLRRMQQKLQDKRDRLDDAFVFQQRIDQETYNRQKTRLEEEMAVTDLKLLDARIEELDLDAILAFASHLLSNAGVLWSSFALDQKQRLQTLLFPNGVVFDGQKLGTDVTSTVFMLLAEVSSGKEHLASPTGFEPVLSP